MTGDCKTCKYFNYIGLNGSFSKIEEYGECRKKSPIIEHGKFDVDTLRMINYQFPVVSPEMWCGEYEVKK